MMFDKFAGVELIGDALPTARSGDLAVFKTCIMLGSAAIERNSKNCEKS